MKKNVKTPVDKIHLEIIAGRNILYIYFVYSSFIKTGKLPKETEVYIKKFNINLVYIHDSDELKTKIENL